MSCRKPRMAVPAVAMRRSVSATCAAMRTLQRCFAGAATTPICLPGSIRAESSRESRNAGARPKRMPQSSASATENARMGALMRMTASAGEDEGFDKQLADDAPATGADRTADGKLMLAGAAPGQQKDGAVGAADDQQE